VAQQDAVPGGLIEEHEIAVGAHPTRRIQQQRGHIQ